jgi:cob(I)alamin adenosyltransferase
MFVLCKLKAVVTTHSFDGLFLTHQSFVGKISQSVDCIGHMEDVVSSIGLVNLDLTFIGLVVVYIFYKYFVLGFDPSAHQQPLKKERKTTNQRN